MPSETHDSTDARDKWGELTAKAQYADVDIIVERRGKKAFVIISYERWEKHVKPARLSEGEAYLDE